MIGGLIKIMSLSVSDNESEINVHLTAQNEYGSEDFQFAVRCDLWSRLMFDISSLPCCISEEQAELLKQKNEQTLAIRSAYRSVSYSPCTRKMLIYKLIQKGFLREFAEFAADFVSEKGYIDESSYALRECEKCLHKFWGRRRILSHLKERGCCDEAMEKAEEYLNNLNFELMCYDFLKKKYGDYPRNESELLKIYSRAMQYGYCGEEIKKALVLMKQQSGKE